ncbi:MAG: T9SS type A sorting domain-containing protein [Ferruginibacter sp.]
MANNIYRWIDVNAVEGTNFYRIQSFNRNGTTKNSEIVKVAIEKTTGSFSVYPNPVSGNVINLLMNNQPAGAYQVKLTNISGQVLLVKSFKSNGNTILI